MSECYDWGDGIFKSIPIAPWYVLSNDIMLSGSWPIRGKAAVWVVPCGSNEQARTVAAHIRRRGDQRRVRIVRCTPRAKRDVAYILVRSWLTRFAPTGDDR